MGCMCIHIGTNASDEVMYADRRTKQRTHPRAAFTPNIGGVAGGCIIDIRNELE